MLVFDCETNGLLHELDRLHCLVVKDTETGEVTRYNGRNIAGGIERMLDDQVRGLTLAGHNVIKFDVPAIRKVYPWFDPDPTKVLDTMVLGRLTYPDLSGLDARLKAQGKLPPKLTTRHSLEAWGHRLGNYKGDYTGGWEAWSQDMEDYCVQDVEVTHALLERLQASKLWPGQASVDLETAVAWVLARQERHGFLFDQDAARVLYVKLAKRRLELEAELKAVFKPFYVPAGYLDPKRDNKSAGYIAGSALTKVKLTEFNPGSRDHIANRLTRLYGWKPEDYTPDGKPKVDEGVLKGLPFPVAKTLGEYFLIEKRIGSVAEGKEAWLKKVGADGRMHGSVNTNGAVTGRMTHSYPNMGQVPAGYSPYGKDCRALFIAAPGKELVGADADALELRCMAHFMAPYDDGAYVRAVNAGIKAEGTDSHSINARLIGLDPKAAVFGVETGRDVAKTWFYAFIYGAGNEKLGFILTRIKQKQKNTRLGKKSREALMAGLPALEKLIKAVQGSARARKGYLRGLDGRALAIRSEHAALNTLLQSAGALVMKRALVILDTNLQREGYVPGVNYEFVANVHDEWQVECDAGFGAAIGKMAVDAIRLAGESFGFRCPLTGAYSVGRTWADTH